MEIKSLSPDTKADVRVASWRIEAGQGGIQKKSPSLILQTQAQHQKGSRHFKIKGGLRSLFQSNRPCSLTLLLHHFVPTLTMYIVSALLLGLAASGHAEKRGRRLLKADLTEVPGNVSPSPWYRSADSKTKCAERPLNLVFMMNPNPGKQTPCWKSELVCRHR